MKISGIREVEALIRSFLSILKEEKITRKEDVIRYFNSLGFHCIVESFCILPLLDEKFGGDILAMYLIKGSAVYRVLVYKTTEIKVIIERYVPNRRIYLST